MTAARNKTAGAVIYTRVSTGEQAEHGTSLESQRDACRAKALALNLPIVAEYEDAGISGGFLHSRQGMMAAVADIQTGRADTLICANISRFSRDSEHQQAIKKSVQAVGGRLVFCDMDFDETPEGDLAFNIMGGFAAYEKAVIKKRTHGGRVHKAEQGLQPGRAHSPMGYHVVTNADALRGDYPAAMIGRYLVMEEEAAIVRELFERYAAGADTLATLARSLNARKLPTRQGGQYWRVNAVRRILQNQVYKGLGVYGKNDCSHDESRLTRTGRLTGLPLRTTASIVPASPETWITFTVPALVSEDLWDAAQRRLSENRQGRSGNPRSCRALAGRVFCPTCGGRMSVSFSRQNVATYYICGRNNRKKLHLGETLHETACYLIAVAEGAVVTSVKEAVQRWEVLSQLLDEYHAQLMKRNAATGAQEPAQVEAEWKRLEAKEKAAVEAQIAGIMAGADPSAYAAVFAQIAQERAALEAERTRLAAATHAAKTSKPLTRKATPRRLTAEVVRILSNPEVPNDEKRGIYATIIEAVYPSKEGAKVTYQPGIFGETTLPLFVNR